MTIFVLKIIATLTMLIDHVNDIIPENPNFILMCIGRISFPIYAFLLTEGYRHTSNVKDYLQRLFVFAIISQLPFCLFRSFMHGDIWVNVIGSFVLGLIGLIAIDKLKNKFLSLISCIGLCIIAEVLNFDYYAYGLLLIFAFYLFKDKKIILAFCMLLLNSLFFIKLNGLVWDIRCFWYNAAMFVPYIFICLYNGEEGRKMQFFYYWFYPVHLGLLYIMKILLV